MNIAIVVNGFPENSETFITNKVIALTAAGNKVSVIRLTNSGNKSLIDLYQLNSNNHVSIINPNVPNNITSLLYFFITKPYLFFQSCSFNTKKFSNQLRRSLYLQLFNNNNFDIIHFEFSGIAVSFLDILKMIKPKTVVSCRGSAEKVKPISEPERIEKLSAVFKQITAIHCVSNDMKNTITPWCNDLDKIFVNRPAIDPTFFSPNKQPSNFNGTSILSIGRFTFQKGYLMGILVVKALIDKGYKIKWNIIGDGIQFEEMLFHIHTLNLQDHIILHGKKNKQEVSDWINKSDIFLLTSVYEGIPNVVLEAMAMQLPVLTTLCGGVDEVIEHEKDGLITPLYDINEIVHQLEKCINNKTLCLEMGNAAREKILADFTLERQLNVFLKAYTKICQNSR